AGLGCGAACCLGGSAGRACGCGGWGAGAGAVGTACGCGAACCWRGASPGFAGCGAACGAEGGVGPLISGGAAPWRGMRVGTAGWPLLSLAALGCVDANLGPGAGVRAVVTAAGLASAGIAAIVVLATGTLAAFAAG